MRSRAPAPTSAARCGAIRTCACFSITFDHLSVDCADAAKFMTVIKQFIETCPETAS